ncbi:hypothetical protein E2C01_052169 [Portunus trituberculatus]|uniref:Uncharacterized protein n=1 Tax=Portunus trituberculatus TaxID=210409 RepID=A0A5B7GNN2_PORTR|nr:hypothetical protein [Portunus trituberculatus]
MWSVATIIGALHEAKCCTSLIHPFVFLFSFVRLFNGTGAAAVTLSRCMARDSALPLVECQSCLLAPLCSPPSAPSSPAPRPTFPAALRGRSLTSSPSVVAHSSRTSINFI